MSEEHGMTDGAVGRERQTELKCGRCDHPQSWHRHDDEKCSTHPQPCHPSTAPYRCLGYDCEMPGYPGGMPDTRCGCPDFIKVTKCRYCGITMSTKGEDCETHWTCARGPNRGKNHQPLEVSHD